jgi:hypothetical protein
MEKKKINFNIGCSLNDCIQFVTKIGIQFSKHYIWNFLKIHFEIIILSFTLYCYLVHYKIQCKYENQIN